jgi:HSP20 family protein
MTLVKFNNRPVEKSFNNLMEDFFNGFNTPEWKTNVPVNIKETKDAYVLDVIAPGFEKTDFKVNLENSLLTISLEKKNETKEENEKEIRREYSYSSFKRSFTLDEKIDSAAIEAKYVNGILTLNLPKKAEVKQAAKEINII